MPQDENMEKRRHSDRLLAIALRSLAKAIVLRQNNTPFEWKSVAKRIRARPVARKILQPRHYLVNKPLPAAGISADNVRGWEMKNEHLAEKRSFEGKCEILRAICQPRTLSADVPASRKGVYLFYNPSIIFFFAIKPRVNMVKKPVVIWWRMRAWLTWGSKSKFDWFN